MRSAAVPLVVLVCLSAIAATATPAAAQDVTLTVSVTSATGSPVSNAELTVTWANGSTTATTAANGKAFVDVPAGADVSIAIEHPVYVRNHRFNVTDVSEREVSITVYVKSSATLQVTDGEGAGLADARIEVYKNDRLVVSGQTGPDGRFETGTIESGEYRIELEKPGYFSRTVTRRTGAEFWNVSLEQGFVTVTFDVSDDHFSPPRPLENVTIRGSTIGSIRTQSNGRQSVSVPVNTVLEVTMTKPGYRDRTRRITVGETDLTVTVTTQRTPALRLDFLADRVVVGEPVLIRATDEYGAPVANATVLVGGTAVAETDAAGEAVITVDETGQLPVQLRKNGLTSPVRNVTGIEPRTATPSPTPTPSPTRTTTSPPTTVAEPGVGIDLPGFGVPVAVLGVLLAVGLLARRRRR